MARLDGKSILIVGGTSGMGLSAARACMREGARVTVVGLDPESTASTLQELGREAAGLGGDAMTPATAERAVALAVERFGELHALYHVAGGSGRRRGDGPLHEITDDGWHYT